MADWWKGRALTQDQHEAINARQYPGTRQLCVECDSPTGRCEDDSMFVGPLGPLCEECFEHFREPQDD